MARATYPAPTVSPERFAMANSPLQTVKAKFKDKAGLISAVKTLMTDELWTDRLNTNKGLDSVSNAKLLRLHAVLSEVKSKFGTRAKLVDAIANQAKRVKDGDFKESLGKLPTPRLLEIFRVGAKNEKRAAN
jgi:hypothetical protein